MAMRSPSVGARAARSTTRIEPPCSRPPRPTIATSAATAGQLGRKLIAAAGVKAGQSALDIGCGPGALTTELVALLGAQNVAAAEPSEPFAQACAQRTGADVEIAAAEALPFADDTFDVTLSQLVVNFMRDAHQGLSEMVRVTRPGGTVAAAVWDYGGEMTLLRTFWDTAIALDPAATDKDEARSMRFATPDELEALWSSRLQDVHVTDAVGLRRLRRLRGPVGAVREGRRPGRRVRRSRSATTSRSRPSSAAGSTSATSRSRSPPAPGS